MYIDQVVGDALAHTSPISLQGLSPLSEIPSLTERDTRSPSNAPNTPSEVTELGRALPSGNPLVHAITTARDRSVPLPVPSSSYNDFGFNDDDVPVGDNVPIGTYGHMLIQSTGTEQLGAGYFAQPPNNMPHGMSRFDRETCISLT